jgi:hypothetical protein
LTIGALEWHYHVSDLAGDLLLLKLPLNEHKLLFGLRSLDLCLLKLIVLVVEFLPETDDLRHECLVLLVHYLDLRLSLIVGFLILTHLGHHLSLFPLYL